MGNSAVAEKNEDKMGKNTYTLIQTANVFPWLYCTGCRTLIT